MRFENPFAAQSEGCGTVTVQPADDGSGDESPIEDIPGGSNTILLGGAGLVVLVLLFVVLSD